MYGGTPPLVILNVTEPSLPSQDVPVATQVNPNKTILSIVYELEYVQGPKSEILNV